MHAVVIDSHGGPEAIRITEVADGAAAESAIRIDVHAAGVAFPDLLMTRGLYQYSPELPFIPGGEIAGIVRDAPNGTGFSPGDRVVALTGVGGAMAASVAVPPHSVFHLPDRVTMAAGAGLLFNYMTIHFAFRHRAQLQPGQSVLVHGAAGGIGTAAVTLAPLMGAQQTIAVVSTTGKEDFIRSICSSDVVQLDNWRESVNDLTGGRGVDIVVDPVGGDRVTDSIRSLASGGKLLIVGFTAGEIPTIKANRLLLKNASAVGVAWGSWWMEDPSRLETQWEEICPLLNSGQLVPPQPKVYPFAAAADALRELERRGAIGKVVLEFRVES